MLLGRLQSCLDPWEEVRILNRSARVGDCPVAAAALVRGGKSAGIYLLQYDPTLRERREEAELAAMAAPLERPRTHREELFAPEDVRPNLPVEQLASISFGGVAYPVETDNCREVAEDWQAILTVTYLLRAGWDMGDLAACPTEGLYLSVYWLEGEFSALPEPEGPLTLVPQERTTSGLAAVDLTLPLGTWGPTLLDLPGGPTVYVTGASLHDPWKHQEEVFSHPKILAQFTPEQLAEGRAAAEKELAGRCPRGMAYPVVHYAAEGGVSIQCYAKSWLDAPLPRPKDGIRDGFALILWERDAPLGPHGLPRKQAVLSEVLVPLESQEAIQVGAVRWHRREAVVPLVLE
mgnify:CR=1 FL=1